MWAAAARFPARRFARPELLADFPLGAGLVHSRM